MLRQDENFPRYDIVELQYCKCRLAPNQGGLPIDETLEQLNSLQTVRLLSGPEQPVIRVS